jgi:hypothetical protein
MTSTAPLPNLPFPLPDPNAVRAAIDTADEQARLLRRLLRLVLRLRLAATTADKLPPRSTPDTNEGEGGPRRG